MDAEKISALVDGEVAEDVSDELSLQDVLLCNEYQLIGELVRASEPVRTLAPEFSAKMAKKLAEEAPHASPESAAQ
jgi:negative regulator of sigma E activity